MHPVSGPLVSIVSPSLNQGRFIAKAIDSVLGQDYPHVELMVVDGASTDETLDVLRGYGARVRWVSEPDAGQAAAINKGFRLTRGDLLAWLNSDDTYAPGAIAAAVECFAAQPEAALVYGDAEFVDAEGRPLSPCSQVRPFDLHRLVHEGDFIVQPAAFFRRSAFEAAGGLDESLHWSMDYDLWLKLARRFPVVYLPRTLAAYRLTGENKTLRGGLGRFQELERLGRRHGARGLAAANRVEKLGFCRREAARLAGDGRRLAALRVLAEGARAVLVSPGALVWLARRLRSRAATAPRAPSARRDRFDNSSLPP